MLVSVEGTLTVDTGQAWFTVGEHQFAVFESDRHLTSTSTGATARFEARISSRELAMERFRGVLNTPFDAPEPYWQLAVATLNTLIAAPPDPAGGGVVRIRGMLEELMLTVLAEDRAAELTRSGSHSDQLRWQADRLISLHFSEPEFSVQTLASQLAISQTHLHRVFAEHNSTPRKAIEQARVQAANDALTRRRTASAMETEEIANSSGFASARQMRSAIQRWR